MIKGGSSKRASDEGHSDSKDHLPHHRILPGDSSTLASLSQMFDDSSGFLRVYVSIVVGVSPPSPVPAPTGPRAPREGHGA